MNIPNRVHFRTNLFVKKDKKKKGVKIHSKLKFREDIPEETERKISKLELEKGDPDFVDERTNKE